MWILCVCFVGVFVLIGFWLDYEVLAYGVFLKFHSDLCYEWFQANMIDT